MHPTKCFPSSSRSSNQRQLRRERPALERLEPRLLLTELDLANLGQSGASFIGVQANDDAGSWVAGVGDVNGDGFNDFVIGARDTDDGSQLDTGAAYLIFGSASSPSGRVDLGAAGNVDVRIIGADGGDFAGFVVFKAGDMNGDGLDDFVISSGGDGPSNSRESAGECYLILGRHSFPSQIDLSTPGTGVTTFFGADAHDAVLAAGAGDVNGDGLDDLIIGSTGGDGPTNATEDSGDCYLVYGRANFNDTFDLKDASTGIVRIYDSIEGDHAGRYVTGVGDINGDGFDDVGIETELSGYVSGFPGFQQQLYVIFGGDSLAATINLGSLGAGGITITPFVCEFHGGLAFSAAGDVNGDGIGDLLYSQDQGAFSPFDELDQVFVIYGATTLHGEIDPSQLGSQGITISSEHVGNRTGWCSDAGDVNSDGYGDILISSAFEDGKNGTPVNAGRVYLVYGGPSLPKTLSLASLGDNGITIYGAASKAILGVSLTSAGDVNGDHFDDFLIGATGTLVDSPTPDAGFSYLIYGRLKGVVDTRGPTVVFTKSHSPVAPLGDVTVDPHTTFADGILTISINAPGSKKKPADTYVFPPTSNLGNPTGPTYAGGKITLQIQLSHSVTAAAVETFLRGITFTTKGKGLKTPTRTITVTFIPPNGSPTTSTRTIQVHKK